MDNSYDNKVVKSTRATTNKDFGVGKLTVDRETPSKSLWSISITNINIETGLYYQLRSHFL